VQPGQGVQTSVTDVAQASKQIGISYGNFAAIQSSLTTNLDPLLTGIDWKGPAATQFGGLYTRYAGQVNRIHRSLELLGELVAKSSRTYDAGEQTATSKVNAVDVPTNITTALAG